VPSKTLIETAELMTDMSTAQELGVNFHDHQGDAATTITVDLARVNDRVKQLAADQSTDIAARLARDGVRVVKGRGRLGPDLTVLVGEETLQADAIIVATGAAPRTLPSAQPDGERILTWEQVYDLTEVPEKLIVVGSGVTGAEFASAYLALGIDVTLVSSRDRVLPGEDADASAVLEDVSTRRGMHVLARSRMQSVTRDGDTVTVTLTDGRTVSGSHCILALGSIPNTADLGLEEAGVATDEGGFITVDRVSRTSARGDDHWVTGRQRQGCRRCGGPVSVVAEVPGDAANRRTWWCPACQPGPVVRPGAAGGRPRRSSRSSTGRR
jgi:dihydrolipoamide dehydrogenase